MYYKVSLTKSSEGVLGALKKEVKVFANSEEQAEREALSKYKGYMLSRDYSQYLRELIEVVADKETVFDKED